jgi:excisionase family DNA binding protein
MTDSKVTLTLTIAEVAELTGLGRNVIEAAIVKGELRAKFVGPSSRYRRILREDIEPWLRSFPDA